jgi:hypothetical protein
VTTFFDLTVLSKVLQKLLPLLQPVESVDDVVLFVSNVAVTVAFTTIWDVDDRTGDVAVTPDTVTDGSVAGGAAVILVGATSASPPARATTTTTLKCCITFS